MDTYLEEGKHAFYDNRTLRHKYSWKILEKEKSLEHDSGKIWYRSNNEWKKENLILETEKIK